MRRSDTRQVGGDFLSKSELGQISGDSPGRKGKKAESYSVLMMVTTKIWYFRVEEKEILENTESLRGGNIQMVCLIAVERICASA